MKPCKLCPHKKECRKKNPPESGELNDDNYEPVVKGTHFCLWSWSQESRK